MLASSMLLCSISEERETIPFGFRSNLGSSGTNNGWGCSDSRKSYKTGLASLAVDDEDSQSQSDNASSSSDMDTAEDDWGFFMDA